MGRSRETYSKKEVRSKQEKKRKDKAKRRLEKKEHGKKSGLDDMIAWVDENGMICSSPPDLTKKKEIKADSIEVGVPKLEARDKNQPLNGRINNFNESKGFGFISCSQLNDSVFFHVNDCEEEVRTGDNVEFETERGVKGLKAIKVKRIKLSSTGK